MLERKRPLEGEGSRFPEEDGNKNWKKGGLADMYPFRQGTLLFVSFMSIIDFSLGGEEGNLPQRDSCRPGAILWRKRSYVILVAKSPRSWG